MFTSNIVTYTLTTLKYVLLITLFTIINFDRNTPVLGFNPLSKLGTESVWEVYAAIQFIDAILHL